MVLVGVVFDHTQQGSVQSGGLLSLGLIQLVGFLKNGHSDELTGEEVLIKITQ